MLAVVCCGGQIQMLQRRQNLSAPRRHQLLRLIKPQESSLIIRLMPRFSNKIAQRNNDKNDNSVYNSAKKSSIQLSNGLNYSNKIGSNNSSSNSGSLNAANMGKVALTIPKISPAINDSNNRTANNINFKFSNDNTDNYLPNKKLRLISKTHMNGNSHTNAIQPNSSTKNGSYAGTNGHTVGNFPSNSDDDSDSDSDIESLTETQFFDCFYPPAGSSAARSTPLPPLRPAAHRDLAKQFAVRSSTRGLGLTSTLVRDYCWKCSSEFSYDPATLGADENVYCFNSKCGESQSFSVKLALKAARRNAELNQRVVVHQFELKQRSLAEATAIREEKLRIQRQREERRMAKITARIMKEEERKMKEIEREEAIKQEHLERKRALREARELQRPKSEEELRSAWKHHINSLNSVQKETAYYLKLAKESQEINSKILLEIEILANQRRNQQNHSENDKFTRGKRFQPREGAANGRENGHHNFNDSSAVHGNSTWNVYRIELLTLIRGIFGLYVEECCDIDNLPDDLVAESYQNWCKIHKQKLGTLSNGKIYVAPASKLAPRPMDSDNNNYSSEEAQPASATASGVGEFIELGLFAGESIASGAPITVYRGFIRRRQLATRLPAILTSHCRSIRNSMYCYDGRIWAQLFREQLIDKNNQARALQPIVTPSSIASVLSKEGLLKELRLAIIEKLNVESLPEKIKAIMARPVEFLDGYSITSDSEEFDIIAENELLMQYLPVAITRQINEICKQIQQKIIGGGLGYMANTSSQNSLINVIIKEHDVDKNGNYPAECVYYATRPIKRGEEILCKYNNNFSRECKIKLLENKIQQKNNHSSPHEQPGSNHNSYYHDGNNVNSFNNHNNPSHPAS
jgi:hypothetical protein